MCLDYKYVTYAIEYEPSHVEMGEVDFGGSRSNPFFCFVVLRSLWMLYFFLIDEIDKSVSTYLTVGAYYGTFYELTNT